MLRQFDNWRITVCVGKVLFTILFLSCKMECYTSKVREELVFGIGESSKWKKVILNILKMPFSDGQLRLYLLHSQYRDKDQSWIPQSWEGWPWGLHCTPVSLTSFTHNVHLRPDALKKKWIGYRPVNINTGYTPVVWRTADKDTVAPSYDTPPPPRPHPTPPLRT